MLPPVLMSIRKLPADTLSAQYSLECHAGSIFYPKVITAGPVAVIISDKTTAQLNLVVTTSNGHK